MPALEETLELDISPALAKAEDLGASLASVAQSFGTYLSEAVSTVFTGSDTTLTLTADGSAVTAEGDVAVQTIDGVVALTADTSQLEAEGNAAAQSVFESQVSNVATGTGNASGILAEGEAAKATAEGLGALELSTKALETANAGLEGSVAGVTSVLGPVGVATAGVTALAGGFFTEAVNEETASRRLEFVFGDLASSIQQVNLPAANFNLSFQQIASSTGASLPGLEQAVSRIGAIGNSAGAAAPQVAETAKQIVAIATYLAVTNPALGSADQIVNQLTNTLQRGGRSASLLGLSLPTKELNAAAQEAVGAGNAVSQFDKIAAGAKIVSDQLGGSLGTAVAKGSDEAALALPKLTEVLKETIAKAGEPLIGSITQVFTQLAPPLEQVVTAIGHLLVAAAPLGVVLGIVLKVLGDLASIITAIPVPILTTAILALTGAMAANAVVNFTTGLLVLGANALADVGPVGLLTAAVDGLMVSLGPLGLAIIALTAGWAISAAIAKNNAESATSFTQSLLGVKAGTDLASESTTTLNQQLATATAKIAELKSQEGGIGGFFAKAYGIDDAKTAQIKALTEEETKLKAALAATNQAAGETDGTKAATQALKDFAAAVQTAADKADGVAVVMSSFATTVNTDVSKAGGQATSVFVDVGAAAVSAAKATQSAGSASSTAAGQMAAAAQHTKDLRDATIGLAKAERDLAILAAGPTAHDITAGRLAIASATVTERDAEQKVVDTRTALAVLAAGPTAAQMAAGWLADAQAARTAVNAEQAVVDARNALAALVAGPTPDTEAQAQEAIAKAQLAREKAALGLSDAQAQQVAILETGIATDRQNEDAQRAVETASFGLTDATRALSQAQAAEAKLRADSLPGSRAVIDAEGKLKDAELALEAVKASQIATQTKQNQLTADALPGSQAMTAARNAESDAELSLAQAQQSQVDVQDRQNKLFSDALPGSVAYEAAVAKIADAQDHLVQVQESGAAKAQAAASKQAKASVDALGDLQKGLDDSLATENKFYADLARIQSEGGLQIVAELLALGPKQGAAEASAVAAATATVVTALETKTETLKTAEDTHAQEISTVFAASLNAGLVKAFADQLRGETEFYANVHTIFLAGNTALALELAKLGPTQGAAAAQAVVSSTPQIQHELEVAAEKLKTVESQAGKDAGAAYGTGLVQGIGAQIPAITAAGAVGGAALHAGATTALQARSPSRLGQQLAEDYASGLVVGMQGSVPVVASAASQLANALVATPSTLALATGSTVSTSGGASLGVGGTVNNFSVGDIHVDASGAGTPADVAPYVTAAIRGAFAELVSEFAAH